ncbi:CRAL/TRIO domain-containing protein, partial [Ramicandelaber brevisporus]
PRTQSARFHHFCLFEEPDAALLRFLRARKWNVQAAFTSLAAAIAWQSNVGLAELLFHGDSALTQDLHLQKGTSLARGQDRLGRPVIFVHTCLHSSNDIPTHADRERFLVLFIESIRMFLRKPIVKIVIVFDLTGFSMANMDMPGIRMLISTLQSYYPECLAYLVAYGVPWMFTGLWKVISKLMDPFVVAKVRFLNKPNEIQKLIEPKYLPEHMAAVEEEEGKYDEASEDED